MKSILPRPAVVAVSCVSIATGCASESKESHPPFCRSVDCLPSYSGGIDATSGGASGDGGGVGVAGASGVVSISGQIVEVDDATFGIGTGILSTTRFDLEAPSLGTESIATSAASIFVLDGVLRSRAAWVMAKPATASDLLTGLVAFDATATTNVVVPVVRSSSLELVAGSVASTLDTTKAQIVLRFTNAAGLPVTGLRVAIGGAERIVYDDGSSYAENSLGTGSRGLAFAFNVPASSLPAAHVLTLSGAATAEFSVHVVAGGATAGEVLVAAK